MAKTAPVLLKHGLPEDLPARKVTGALLAYRDDETRKEFLSIGWLAESCGAVEQHGGLPQIVRRVPQEEMARRLGIDRSTLNRRIGMFSDPDGRWDEERRRRFSESQRSRVHQEGKKLTGRPIRSVERIYSFFNKNAGIGQTQLYTWHMKQELKPRIEKKKSKTANAEMLAEAFGVDRFDPKRKGVNNYKTLPGFVFDHRLPDPVKCPCQYGQLCILPGQTCPKCSGEGVLFERDSNGDLVPMADYGRVLFTYWVLKGLLQYGHIDISQRETAEDIGCDVNTVAKYEGKWEMLKTVRFKYGDVTRRCIRCSINFVCRRQGEKLVGSCSKCGAQHGPVVDREPHKIIYIGDSMLDEGIVARERQRLQALQQQVEARAFAQAAEIHDELQNAWRGREHSLKAFFAEMRRRLASAHVDKHAIETLFPFYRE